MSKGSSLKKRRKATKAGKQPAFKGAPIAGLSKAQQRKQDAMSLAQLIYDIYKAEKDTKL